MVKKELSLGEPTFKRVLLLPVGWSFSAFQPPTTSPPPCTHALCHTPTHTQPSLPINQPPQMFHHDMYRFELHDTAAKSSPGVDNCLGVNHC